MHLTNADFVHTAPDEFSTGWKMWPVTLFTWNSSIFSRCLHGTDEPGWILNFVRGFSICLCAKRCFGESKMASSSWGTTHPCNHAFNYKHFDGCGLHTALVKFSTVPPKDLTSSLVLKIFERLDVTIFVRLRVILCERSTYARKFSLSMHKTWP